MNDADVFVFATGGTIAGVAGSATKRDYRPGQIGIDEFLAEGARIGLPECRLLPSDIPEKLNRLDSVSAAIELFCAHPSRFYSFVMV